MMGGESIEALQIYKALVDRGVEVHQITHSRVREEMRERYPEMKVTFVEEDRLDYFLWRTRIFSYFGTPYFMARAARIAKGLRKDQPDAVAHYTSPISPVVPTFPIEGGRVVVGPLNGNIHHPRPSEAGSRPSTRSAGSSWPPRSGSTGPSSRASRPPTSSSSRGASGPPSP
jgi:hypothetical protein